MSIIDPMMESKHHLPECFVVLSGGWRGDFCICDRVSAAEQRAIAAMREPGRVRVLIEAAEQRGREEGIEQSHPGHSKNAIGREGVSDVAKDLAAQN